MFKNFQSLALLGIILHLYVMCAMQERQCVTPAALRFQWCQPSTSGTVLTGTNWKEDSPVKTAHRVIEIMLTGCIGVFKGIIVSQTLTAVTTQSNTLKGNRLQKCRHISMSILACMSTPSRQLNSEQKWTPGPPVAQHSTFYRVDPWRHAWAHDVTNTSWDDVTSIPCDIIPGCYIVTAWANVITSWHSASEGAHMQKVTNIPKNTPYVTYIHMIIGMLFKYIYLFTVI